MDKSSHQYYEKLLGAYELGFLSDEERKEFEEHYFDCESCFQQVSEFQEAARLLRNDHAVFETAKDVMDSSYSEGDRSIGSWLTRTVDRRFRFAGTIVAAALVFLLAIPTYRLMFVGRNLQTVRLVFARGEMADRAVDLGSREDVELKFRYDNAKPGSRYFVTVSSMAGSRIFSDSSFSEFSDQGRGSIVIPIEAFSAGFYSLSLSDAGGALRGECVFKAE